VGLNGVYQGSKQPAGHFPDLSRESAKLAQGLPATYDLEVAFSHLRQELRPGTHMGFRLVVEGKSRELHPSILEKAYRIGREAVLNSFRHSEASRVEVELEYTSMRLRIAVRDNGKGIADGLFLSGGGNYRGLFGMRELAERMGAKLRLMSRAAAGTEIELSIPGQIAFASHTNTRLLDWRMPETEEETAGGLARRAKMTTPAQIRILTVDNHPLLLEGLAVVIQSQPDMVLVGQASNGHDAIQQFGKLRPDVVLMDLKLPDMSGIDGMIAIQAQFPEARIIAMTTFEGDGPIERALQAGARSYILKNMPPREIAEVIRHVHAGHKRFPSEIAAKMAEHLGEEKLTDREVYGLRQSAGGRSRDIAAKLFIAEETVKAHMKHMLERLGAIDGGHAVMIAARRGFIQL